MSFKPPKLIFVKDDKPGFTRNRAKDGFTYVDITGSPISEAKMIERFNQLVIPPMWENVWICPVEEGYLQATGRDLKRRKQYIYHEKYTEWRQWSKFRKMQTFAECLPVIRQTTDAHLQQKKWTKQKVLALAVKVLDETAVRIGNQYYTDRNQTYGLTTLRRRHLDLDGEHLTFDYLGKSSKKRHVDIEDKRLVKLIKQCSELPGYELFRYQQDGKFHSIDSSDINNYLREITQEELSGKDFRTWVATSLGVELFLEAKMIADTNTRKKLEPTLVKLVSKKLGNTMAVCREYYIHPKILYLVKNEKMPSLDTVTNKERKKYQGQLDDAEILALKLIKKGN